MANRNFLPLTHERLIQVLRYDAASGTFTWLVALSPKTKVGQIAGVVNSAGYRKITLDGVVYAAHRLAWFYVNRVWPSVLIDHRNGVRDDNRIDNLREQDAQGNAQNRRKAAKRNSSGLLGVTTLPGGRRFSAKIYVSGHVVQLGKFSTAEEASAAYLAAKRLYHPAGTL